MDIDLVTMVVRVTAARIFVPAPHRAGRRPLAAAVRTGIRHLHPWSAPPASTAPSPFRAATREGAA